MSLFYLSLGLLAGVLSGFLGIGGGSILIPAFVFLLGMSQHQAQGTTLALMVPPIGLLAAWRYYIAGDVKIKVALWVCIGFFLGALVGAEFVQKIPDLLLKRIFGLLLLSISLRMIWGG
ncbi:MAG: sulfite exporter TauE/SafE family protein [Candidatus Omnitrophica bacterium]|nr:sulfite exporter TauE/SafE family protein [Candidatus Omnitrophota bacterium]